MISESLGSIFLSLFVFTISSFLFACECVCVLLFILFVVVCGDGVLPGLTFYKVQAASYNRVSISIQIMPLLCFKGFKNSTV